MQSHTSRSPSKGAALPLYVSLTPFDLCQHCGILSRPEVRVITSSTDALVAHTRQMLDPRHPRRMNYSRGAARQLLADDGDAVTPLAWSVIEVHEHDLLPSPQESLALPDRQNQ